MKNNNQKATGLLILSLAVFSLGYSATTTLQKSTPIPAPQKVSAAVTAAKPAPQAGKPPFDTLAGRLPKVITADKSPYVVMGDIQVPQGRTIVVEPGVIFLFSNFTGLKVQGTLLAKGTAEKPIIFTSVNDSRYNPGSSLDAAPYDWNGIHIYEDGIGSTITYASLSYSVYGIIAVTRFIRIGPLLFANNGRGNMTIEGKELDVGDKPFEYAPNTGDARGDSIKLTILRDPQATQRAILRYGGAATFVGGALIGALYTHRYGESRRKLEKLSSKELQNLSEHSSAEWNKVRATAIGDMVIMGIGYLFGAAGAVGFTWSFNF